MTGPPVPGAFAVVVVNFASSHLLVSALIPMVDAAQVDIVVIVDCFSSDSESSNIERLCRDQGWHPVLLADNKGFGGGMNAGVERSSELGATELLLLNPDASIDPRSVAILRDTVRGDSWILVSPRIETPDGRAWFTGSDLSMQDGTTRSASRRGEHPDAETWSWISGACMAMSAALWRRVGGFDESYFLYWEDVDLSRRVTEAGGHLAVQSDALAVHDEGGTHPDRGTARGRSATYYRYMIRNRLLFATKHLDADGIRRWRRSAPANAWQILLHGGRRQFLHPVGPARAAWRGLREGRALASQALRQLRGKPKARSLASRGDRFRGESRTLGGNHE